MQGYPDFIPQQIIPPLEDSVDTLVRHYLGDSYEISEKLDGQQVIIYTDAGMFGVCVGGYTFPPTQLDVPAVKFMVDNQYDQLIPEFGKYVRRSFVIQGELIGPGIKENPYGLEEHKFFVFDVIDINDKRKLSPQERLWALNTFNENPRVLTKLENAPYQLYMTPFAPAARALETQGGWNNEEGRNKVSEAVYDDLKAMSTGPSTVMPTKPREGLVFKSVNSAFTFVVDA